jgi:uncharacterized protein
VDISFDAAKNARDIATRGISFEQALAFEWDTALIVADTRKGYGERRFQALGLITERLHVLVHAAVGQDACYQPSQGQQT